MFSFLLSSSFYVVFCFCLFSVLLCVCRSGDVFFFFCFFFFVYVALMSVCLFNALND